MNSAGAQKRTRRARGSINRAAILQAGREVVERDGLGALSMGALARQLECGTMSIYGHFDNKGVLVAALSEEVLRDFVRQLPPPGDGPWRQEVVATFSAYRSLMETYAAYRELVLYAPISILGPAFTPAQLRRLDAGVALFTRAGMATPDAVRVYNVLLNYTRCFVAFEHGVINAGARPEDRSTPVKHEFSAADYPLLSQLEDIAPLFDLDDDGFALGLDLLLDGIESRYLSRSRTRGTRRS